MRALPLLCKLLPALLSLLLSSACDAEPPEQGSYSADAVRQDFDALYEGLKASHFDLFAHRPKEEYDTLYADMRRAIAAPMTRTDAEVYFQKFVAYGNVAHANIAFPSAAYEAFRAEGGKAFPLLIRYIGDELMVFQDMSGAAPSLGGARIFSINGESAEAIEKRLSAHLSADNQYLSRTMLEFRFGQLLWLEFGEVEAFTLGVETPEGERRSVSVRALAREALVDSNEPVFELDWNERRYEVIDGVGYLRPGPFYNNAPDAADMWDNAAFKAFIDEAFETFIAEGVPAVLIDLRANPGGDNSFSDLMIAWFADRPFKFASHFYVKVSEATIASNAKRLRPGDATSTSARFARAFEKAKLGDVIDFDLGESPPREGERYKGSVAMLIDRHSYSNTVTVAALAQDYGFATILGEETSDLATTYGAMETFSLPNTGIEVGFPKAHIIRPNGSLEARGVIPDIAIAEPLRSREDDMLKEALRLIGRDLGAKEERQ
ncbi:MAG: S41 family peptidase [Parvularculaceae bacterium]